MFRSRKAKTEFITGQEGAKDWRDAGAEIERLGQRLDAARGALHGLEEGTWAHNHWTQIEAILFRKWSLAVTMQRVGLKQIGPQRMYNIDYEWFEESYEVGMVGPAWLNQLWSKGDFDYSWEKAKEQKLQKARQGQA